jgi:ATP-binding cassette, subfamily F, member 3
MLLLDEPTNHLDLEARNWLEEFLCAYPHASSSWSPTIATSSTSPPPQITEVSGGRLTDYPAPTTRATSQVREETLEQERAAYEAQQEEIERIEAFISRFRYQASKAALVQSRIKHLDKLERLPAPGGRAQCALPLSALSAQRPGGARASRRLASSTATSSSTAGST